MVVTLPEAMANIDSKVERANRFAKADSFRFSVFGAPVPAVNVPSTEVAFAGQVLRVSSHSRPVYDPITVGFDVDNEYNNYWFCWKWLDVLNDAKESGFDIQNLAEHITPQPYNSESNNEDLLLRYSSNISIIGHDEYNNDKIKFTYTNAFPTRLGGLDYRYRDVEQLTCEMEIVFTQMHVELL